MKCLWRGFMCMGAVALLLWGPGARPAAAHELRPGYLEINGTGPDRYEIRFKVPGRGGLRLKLHARLPDECRPAEPSYTEEAGNAFIDRMRVHCPGGLAGRTVTVDGLAGTFTDVVARISIEGGQIQTARLTPDRPYLEIAANPSWADTARAYFLLGVEHILLGIDHLLFVLALLLLVPNAWALVRTVTAFTVAHSITLAAASLGWAHAPQTPVEALIALSIAFAAAEATPTRQGGSGLLRHAPWLAAFGFGLLHGFGFGGALKEIGLPQSDVPLALLTFNLGVEAGQLLFIGVILVLRVVAGRLAALRVPHLRAGTAYAIGTVAVFWFAERMSALF